MIFSILMFLLSLNSLAAQFIIIQVQVFLVENLVDNYRSGMQEVFL